MNLKTTEKMLAETEQVSPMMTTGKINDLGPKEIHQTHNAPHHHQL